MELSHSKQSNSSLKAEVKHSTLQQGTEIPARKAGIFTQQKSDKPGANVDRHATLANLTLKNLRELVSACNKESEKVIKRTDEADDGAYFFIVST
jgi:hypothetical protein